jgi:putative transposase
MADLSLISDAAWREARRRAEVIRPLAERERRPRHLILAAAAALGLSERQTYTLVRRCLDAGGDLTALLPGGSSGGRARPRVATVAEAILHQTVHELYLTRQKPTAARVVREVFGRCGAGKLRSPSPSTIRTMARIHARSSYIGVMRLSWRFATVRSPAGPYTKPL